MANQIERQDRKASTSSTQSKLDSLAAILLESNWSEDSIQAQTPAAEIEKDETHTRLSSSPHDPPAAPDLPSGTFRRRNIYIVAAADNCEGEGGINDDGGGDLHLYATNSSLPPPPFALREKRRTNINHDAPTMHHGMISVAGGIPSAPPHHGS